MLCCNTLGLFKLGLVALVSSLALSACSDSEPSSRIPTLERPSTSVANEEATSDEEAYVTKVREFVDCVRKAGFPEMRDPTDLGGIVRDDLLRLQGAKGKAIMSKCYPIIEGLPVPPELQKKRDAEAAANLTDDQKASYIAFSKCMQENGVPQYPDPEPNGLPATEPWALPDATVAPPPGLQAATDACHKILDPSDP